MLFRKKRGKPDLQIRKLLEKNFGIKGFYWYPLSEKESFLNCEYFDASEFERNYGKKLHLLIGKLSTNQIHEITETEEDSTIELNDIDYKGFERIYCDENVNWVIYFSHENTITFAGEKLLQFLKNDWRDWKRFRDPWKLDQLRTGKL